MKKKLAILTGTMVAVVMAQPRAYPDQTNAPAQLPGATLSSPRVGEVVKLAQSGVGDEVVIAYIKNSPAPYNLSAADLEALKNDGLSGPVMAALTSHDQLLHQVPAAKPDAPAPPVATAPANLSSTIPNAPTVPDAPTVSSNPSVAEPILAEPMPPRRPPLRFTEVEQPPPSPRLEMVPVAPGTNYYWIPGYWRWNGTWAWEGGRWVARPWPGAYWVRGHWSRHGRGYLWVSGRWR